MVQEVKMMVGIPGSGKSTLVKNLVKFYENQNMTTCVISRDYIRKNMLKEDEAYFDKETLVFNKFIEEINDSMVSGANIVFIDATHINPASRNKTLSRLNPDKNAILTFEVMKTDLDTCLARNRKREGFERVPDDVIKKMTKNFKNPTANESLSKDNWGFAKVRIHLN